MKKVAFTIVILISNYFFSQKIISQEIYEGTLNDKPITLYLKISESGCPNIYAEAIYKYKSNDNNNWLLLDVVFSEKNNLFTLVEHYNTGILLLNKETFNFNGIWIAPDGKKQLKVELKKVKSNLKTLKNLEEKLEKENYEANDC